MKMAVVGCEASGKTVFMCALADYFGRDAATNPLRLKLTPENAAANGFERYQFRQMRCLRQWPSATPPDRTIELKWSLRHEGQSVASIDLLEFGGETYRAAFREGSEAQREGSVAELFKYLGDADFFVVLVSIKQLLTDPSNLSQDDFDRETEALWVTRGLLDFITTHRPDASVVIGLTQADRYQEELDKAGGPQRLFAEKWPTVAAGLATIPIVDVASVSRTDAEGNPAEDYSTRGIMPVMRLFSKRCFGNEEAIENGTLACAAQMTAEESDPKEKSPTDATKRSAGSSFGTLLSILLAIGALGALGAVLYRQFPQLKAFLPRPEPTHVERIVTNTVEKIVSSMVTNTVEKIVERPVTNVIEKVIERIEEKVVERPVTNTVERLVEKIVEKPVTNTIERIVERVTVMTNVIETAAVAAPTGIIHSIAAEMPKEADLPADYRTWTDYNGRKIVAKWMGVAVDKSGITLLNRFDRRIDAVLWKFSREDQAYIKDEIRRHEEAGEVLSNGVWKKNPMLKKGM